MSEFLAVCCCCAFPRGKVKPRESRYKESHNQIQQPQGINLTFCSQVNERGRANIGRRSCFLLILKTRSSETKNQAIPSVLHTDWSRRWRTSCLRKDLLFLDRNATGFLHITRAFTSTSLLALGKIVPKACAHICARSCKMHPGSRRASFAHFYFSQVF